MAGVREFIKCDHCDGIDDHPKVHYGLETYHHDCTPASVKSAVLGGHPDPENLAKVFEAANGGKRGAELLSFIKEVHGESNG